MRMRIYYKYLHIGEEVVIERCVLQLRGQSVDDGRDVGAQTLTQHCGHLREKINDRCNKWENRNERKQRKQTRTRRKIGSEKKIKEKNSVRIKERKKR